MFNLFPGQGLGGWTFEDIIRYIIVRLIAFGLGFPLFPPEPEAVVVDHNVYGGGGKAYVPRFEWDDIIGDIERRERIAHEDEEILQVIIAAISSGVIE